MAESKSSDARPAVKDLISAIRSVFQKYTRTAREKSWKDGIESAEGRKTVHRLINNPSVPVVGAYRFLKFKEWINQI